MPPSPICQRRCKSVETIYHALLECKAAKKIWTHAPLQLNFQSTPNQSILRIVQDMSSNMRKSDFELLISLCWTAWYALNKFIFEGKKIDPRLSAPKAESVIEAFQRARRPGASHIHISSKVHQQKWKLPSKNLFKINVDAAINNKNQVAGLGPIIKDSENKIVAAGIKQNGLKDLVSYAKVEAIEWGLKLARKVALSTLIVESDCLEVVELVNNTKSNRTCLWWIIEEIQSQKREFRNVIVNHIPRTCNICAHSLAKYAVVANGPAVWLDFIPAEVMNVLV